MANRHLARSIAMQSLFEWDFGGEPDAEMEQILSRNVKEFAPGLEDDKFVRELANGVLKNRKKLDSIIEKAAPEWPLDQIAIVDRNVLRLGLFELLFEDRKEVPPKVAINESIELAKTFGSDSSGKFVYGVLGTVYREIGEPGKDETSKKKDTLDPSDYPVEKLGGGVIYRRAGSKIFFALVHDVFGYWTLSKGHLEGDEKPANGTKRELEEELGLSDIKIGAELGMNEYVASDPKIGKVRKQVQYFLAQTDSEELKLAPSGGLDDAKWFTPGELEDLKTYDDIKPMLAKALKLIKKK